MRKILLWTLASSVFISASLHGQAQNEPAKADTPASAPSAAPVANDSVTNSEPATVCCTIPALTVVQIEILSTVNSQANKIGEKFAIRLVEPIVVDGKVIVPAGTTGSGDVVHAAKSRFGGRPGELIIAVRYLDYRGQRIPLRSLRFASATGNDKGGSAMAASIAGGAVGGVVSMFITGGEVNVPAGSVAEAKVAAATVIKDLPTEGSESR